MIAGVETNEGETMGKNVVVLGGGYAGTAVAVALDKDKSLDVTVTLVDPRQVFFHKIGGLRASMNPTWHEKVLVSREKTLSRGKFVQASVSSIDQSKNEVALDNGTTLSYDVLVCATGSANRSPGEIPASAKSLEDITQFFKSVRDATAASNSIVIIGGGVVGVELAGEIREAFPDKKIAITQSGKNLIASKYPINPDSTSKKLVSQLEKKGIEVHLNSRADVDFASFNGAPYKTGQQTVKLSSGKELSVDLIFNCTGASPNSSFYPESWRDSFGMLKVDPNLKVEGTENVFACGDVTNVPELKLAYTVNSVQAPALAKNLKAFILGKPLPKVYKAAGAMMMVIPVGSKGGVLATKWGTMGAFIASAAKGKKLFYNMGFEMNNLKVPKA